MAEPQTTAPAAVGNGVALGRGHTPAPPSTDSEIEESVTALMAKREEWFNLDCATRAQLIRECKQSTGAVVEEVATALTNAKGAYGKGISEEMGGLAAVLLAMDALAASLEADGQRKPVKLTQRTAADGKTRWIADVSPQGLDAAAFGGVSADVWIKPGEEPTQGKLYRDKAAGLASVPSGIAAVLAAGNQLNVTVVDILNQLLLHDSVVAVKLNPCLDYTGPYLERMLAPLHSRGFFRCLYGGADVAQKLVHHKNVGRLCMTGSGATYDAIMWGPGKPKTGTPLLNKPFDAELGCVTPVIIVPGTTPWTEKELEFQAERVLSTKVINAGHNCLSTELIVTAAHWPQREQFMAAVRSVLERTQQRWPWYPGSDAKYAAFKKRFPNALQLGMGAMESTGRSTQPWLLAEGLTPDQAETQSENWCGVLQEVMLDTLDPGENVAAFLEDAVRFCNERCMGSLSMSIIVHPETQKQHGDAFQRALEELRYGAVAVNLPTTFAFVVSGMPWGAWAAAGTPQDIGSGNAIGGNAYMFDAVEKGVVTGQWVEPVKPGYFPTAVGGVPVLRRLSAFLQNKTIFNLIMIIATAMLAPWFDKK